MAEAANSLKKLKRLRRAVQLLALFAANGYWPGFARAAIYTGPAKAVCVPFLNCYSCPAALFACPVGSLQAFLAATQSVPLYVGGLLVTAGAAAGRLFCGWLCPFGLLQEALSLPRSRQVRLPRGLQSLKYVVLALTLLLPVAWVDGAGLGAPYFCKFLCPAGTLEAGLPLVLGRPELRALTGWLFTWKVAVLAFFLALMPFVFRVFCRTACPLGAFYSLFNPLSLWRLERDGGRCTGCGTCGEVCPVGAPVMQNPNHPECVRCLECTRACPSGALVFRFAQNKAGWAPPTGAPLRK
ncbi:MAG: 4Fe-4S binding protein [Bacillota bacterium]